jgi:Rrf2 family protein
MLSISKRTDYGLLLLSLISRTSSKQYNSIKNIAKDNRLPYKYLSQIAIDLKKAGILISKEGANGGYRLKASPDKLMLSQIIEALEGELLVSCSSSHACACGHNCLHEGVMEKILGGIEDYSLSDLIG